MPEISYQASVQPEPLPGRAYPRLPQEVPSGAFGEGVGSALEYAGSEAEQHFKAAQDQARQTQLTDAHNQLQALSLGLTHDPKTGAFTKQGKDAFGLSQQYLPQFDQNAADIVSKVPDPRARQAAQLAAAQVRDHLSEQLDTHEIEQHKVFGVETAKSSVKLAIQTAAANYNHPDILATQSDHVDASLESLGQQQGWSKDELADAKQEAHSNLHSSVLERMIGDGQDKLAGAYLKTHRDDIDSRQYESFASHIEAKEKEKQNEAKQGIADRYQDSLRGAEYGLPNAIQVSRQELDLLYPKDAQRHWDELQIMQQAGARAKAYDQMTPAQIDADVEASRPKEGAPEALYHIEAQQIMERARDKSLRDRQADPAQFLVSRGNWQPLNWQNPQTGLAQLQSRARTQQELSGQIGMPSPLMTKGEAKQVAGALDGASPQNAAAMLGQLRSALPSSGFDSILSQIAPHSPVLAVAASMVDAPPKASAPPWYDARFAPSSSVAEGIINGERILSGKGEEKPSGGFQLPPDNDGAKTGLLTYFNDAAGGRSNTLFAGRADSAEIYYHAFKAYYADLASKAGHMSGEVDPDMAREAATAVLGDVARLNHTDIPVPRGMDPTQFETIARAAIEQSAKAGGLDASHVAAARDGAGLAEYTPLIGTGRYAVLDGSGQTIRGKDGRGLTIDLSKTPVPPKSGGENIQALLMEKWAYEP